MDMFCFHKNLNPQLPLSYEDVQSFATQEEITYKTSNAVFCAPSPQTLPTTTTSPTLPLKCNIKRYGGSL